MSLLAGAQLGLDVGTALLNRYDQRRANKQNIALSREQMAFQERMRNTQYQAAAKDLEKAGLNRILALGSPAAAPAGSTATVESESRNMPKISAMELASAKAAIDNQRQQNQLLKADTRIKNAQAGKEEMTKMMYEKLLPHVDKLTDAVINNISNPKDVKESFKDGAKRVLEMHKAGRDKITSEIKDAVQQMYIDLLLRTGRMKKMDSNYRFDH